MKFKFILKNSEEEEFRIYLEEGFILKNSNLNDTKTPKILNNMIFFTNKFYHLFIYFTNKQIVPCFISQF